MRAMSRYFSSILVVAFAALTLLVAGCGEAPVDDEQSSDTVSQGETAGAEDTAAVDDTSSSDTSSAEDTAADSSADGSAGDSSTEQDASSPDAAPTCPGAPGCACEQDSECTSGLCATGADGKSSCAAPCDDKNACESGVCATVDGAKVCVDPFVATCSPCLTNVHCDVPGATEGACVDRGPAGSFCATGCSVDDDCAQGYACVDSKDVTGKEAKRCLPKQDAECTCNGWAKLKALTTSCYADGLPGCESSRTCEEKGLSACEPAAPQAETCDGVDQDCDGTTDNGSLCDDGNPCTQDACGGPAGCTATNDDSANCDDGDACTTDDKCEAGACKGPATQCDDNNVCTDDSCDKAKGCVNLPNKVTCDDADACTESEACSGGFCVGTKVGCDDNNICTDDSCDPTKGCVNLPNTVTCTDGDACTTDTCKDTKCISTAKNCDDGNTCTTEFCDKAKGCQFLKNALPCTDGDACTSEDTCKGGQCSLSNPKNCDDSNVCTIDSCDKKTGECSNTAVKDGQKCDDGSDCTLNDACDKGACKGKEKTCDDGNPCTLDVCVAGKGCDSVDVGCDDDDVCTTEPSTCNPQVGCGLPKAVSPCNQNQVKFPYQVGFKCGGEASKAWTLSKATLGPAWAVDKTPAKPKSEIFDCSLNFNNGKDFNCPPNATSVEGTATSPEISIVGALSPALNFVYGGEWESSTYDNLLIEVVDVVSKTSSQLASLDGSPTWKPMTYDLKPYIGKTIQIRFTFKTTDCVDNDGSGPFIDAVSVTDLHCTLGGCNDGDPCTKGTCDALTGKCNNVPNLGAPCDDGNPCSNSFCDKVGKCAGTPWVGKACDDGNPCTKDACDDKGACVGTPSLGANCDDDNECTTQDACTKEGQCQGNVAAGKACDDGQVCTGPDKCDLAAKCIGPPAKGKACDDTDLCTTNDVCDEKAECAGVSKCDDGNECTVEKCDENNGFCKFDTTTEFCNDGNECSLGDTCKDGICFAGSKTDCDDGNGCTADLCDAKTGLCAHNVIQGCKVTCKLDADCADTDPCTANTCDVKTGACKIAPAKDGSVCGVSATCFKGGCSPLNPVDGWAIKLDAYSTGQFRCALLKNKTVACWGRNTYGQLGDGTNLTSGKPVAVKDLKNIADIAVGYQHACAVDQQGKIYCWGYNSSYQLGDGTTTSSKVPVAAVKGITDAIAVSAGYNHTCVIRKDKTVVCWGGNTDGQSGDSANGSASKIKAMTSVDSIFTGLNLSCAIRSDGSKWCWGRNQYNVIRQAPDTFSFKSPTRDDRTSKWSLGFAGNGNICGLTYTGVAECVGLNSYDMLGVQAASPTAGYVNPQGLSGVTGYSGGLNHGVWLTNSGVAYAAGRNQYGQLGDGTKISRATPKPMVWVSNIVQVSASYYNTCVLRADGSVWCTGANLYGSLGGGSTSTTGQKTRLSHVADGACQTDAFCKDDNICTKQQCALSTGLCTATVNGNAFCDDGDKCTLDGKCDTNGICQEKAKVCDDGNPCTTEEACEGGKCFVVKNANCDDGNPCTTDACDTKTGNCTHSNVVPCVVKCTDDAGCSDNQLCTSDKCVNGLCQWSAGNEGAICGLSKVCTAGACTAPKITGFATQIAQHPNGRHACALRPKGTVSCWGYNNNGQLGNGFKTNSTLPVAVQKVTNATAVAVGYLHSCAIVTGGKVMCWGDNLYGQLGNGSTTDSSSPVEVKGITGAVSLAMTNYSTCAVTLQGAVKCWGRNTDKELGSKSLTSSTSSLPVDANVADVVAIDGGYGHYCALNKLGETFCWGYNYYSNAMTTASISDIAVTKVAKFPKAVSLGVGYNNTCVVSVKGELHCIGQNSNGQLGIGSKTPTDSAADVYVAKVKDVAMFTGGLDHGVTLSASATISTWGDNYYGQLGNGTKSTNSTNDQTTPAALVAPKDTIQVSAGYRTTCALHKTGSVWCVGYNVYGALGNGKSTNSELWTRVADGACSSNAECNMGQECYANTCDIVTAKCNIVPTVGKLCDDGDLCTTGDACSQAGVCAAKPKDCDDGNACTFDPVCEAGQCKQLGKVSCDDKNPCTVDLCDTKTGACSSTPLANCKWTCKQDAECDDGKPCTKDSCDLAIGECKQVAGNDGAACGLGSVCKAGGCGPLTSGWAKQIDSHDYGYHTCALMMDKKVFCWGRNNYGQVGKGSTSTSEKVPVQVVGLVGVKQVSGGFYHSCAVAEDGALYCWGSNSDGQIGNNSTVNALQPTVVLKGVESVDCGDYHTCAVKSDGTVWCWGRNTDGQIGNGIASATDIKIPTQVKNVSNIVEVSLGKYFSCGRTKSGIVRCWGSNYYNNISSPSTADIPNAVTVTDLPPASAISAGSYSLGVLDAKGNAWAKGYNPHGFLGLGKLSSGGTYGKETKAFQIKAFGTGLWQYEVGYYLSYFLKPDSQAYAIGYNQSGGLGNGSTTTSLTPVKITNGFNVVQVTARYRGGCVLTNKGDVWCTGYGTYGGNGDNKTTATQSTLVKVLQPVPTVCGDAKCEGLETPLSCIKDCKPICGNGTCDPTETLANCEKDCKKPHPCDGSCGGQNSTFSCWCDSLCKGYGDCCTAAGGKANACSGSTCQTCQ